MLPIEGVIPEFLEALRSSRAVVLVAPPGAGKTTGIPPAILESGLCPSGTILMLQPRRMAARAAAARMAKQRSERVGGTVGYQIRFDKKASKDTRILVVTEGILTRRFLSDPLLEGTACVILDEFHERSVHVDLALAFCRELMEVREDLRLVVMSATLETGPVAAYLGGCPVISGGERPYDVDVVYQKLPDQDRIEDKTARAVRGVLQNEGGDILVFLPGAPEIRRTQEALRGVPEVLPLYGALPAKEQDKALVPGKGRRVILATNIAETSLTVPGVTAVIDGGWCKQMQYDPHSGLDRLQLTRISKQSAAQRSGRAGRTAPGRVLRLWTEHEHRALPQSDQPEIVRVDLAAQLLSVMAFHPGDPREFEFFQPPKPAVLEASLDLLSMLGAVEPKKFKLTKKGRRLAEIPAHPRIGSLLLPALPHGAIP
jgi:ATP-dependent helicase HrpB